MSDLIRISEGQVAAFKALRSRHELEMSVEVGRALKGRFRAGCTCGWVADDAFGRDVEDPGGAAEDTYLEHMGTLVMDAVEGGDWPQ